jgi:thiamine biosynthesis lipoprotein
MPAQLEPPYLLQFSRRAMACEFELTVNAGQYVDAGTQALAALDHLEPLETQMTVFRETSEVADINRRAADEAVVVEPRLFELFETCLRLYRETDGAFDMTSGPLTKVWGFYRRAGRMPSRDDVQAAMARVGSDKIVLEPQRRTIRFTEPGVEINLGSIGKGHALDRCGEALRARGISDFCFHGGRSSILAHGSQFSGDSAQTVAQPEPPLAAAAISGGWLVGIADPLRPRRRLGSLRLRDRGLGTSGSGSQFFRHRGRRYGHILDPRTGWPAQGVYSVTVLAPTAALADGLATALYVLGPAAAERYCQSHPGVAMFMVCREGGGRPEIRSSGFADDELTITSSA